MHATSAEEVQVEMIHRLTAVVATVNYGAVAVSEALLLRKLPCHDEEVTNEITILGLQVVERRDRLPRNDKNVRRGLRINVVERHTPIILVDDVRIRLTVDDPLK